MPQGELAPCPKSMISLHSRIKISQIREQHRKSHDKIFYPANANQQPNLQKLLTLLNDCTEQEAADLLPMVRYLLDLLHKQDHPTL